MHGPDDPVLGWAPHYSVPIPIIDSVAYRLGPLKRAIWRRARDRALGLWQVPFALEEEPEPAGFTYGGDPIRWFSSGKVRLLRGPKPTSDGYFPLDYAVWLEDLDAAVAVLTPLAHWWQDWNFRTVAALICHELGHCLGLAHRSDGGVMAGAWKPDDHDLSSVKEWYL